MIIRDGVEDIRLEAKAKNSKTARGQGKGQAFRGQTLSMPRPRTQGQVFSEKKKKKVFKLFFQILKVFSQKKGLQKNSSGDLRKKVFKNFCQTISKRAKRIRNKVFTNFPQRFWHFQQNFNDSNNSAVFEPRTR